MVATLEPTPAGESDAALVVSRTLSQAGEEVIHLGVADVDTVAHAAVAEDATTIVLAGSDGRGRAGLRLLLDELGASDVTVVGSD